MSVGTNALIMANYLLPTRNDEKKQFMRDHRRSTACFPPPLQLWETEDLCKALKALKVALVA